MIFELFSRNLSCTDIFKVIGFRSTLHSLNAKVVHLEEEKRVRDLRASGFDWSRVFHTVSLLHPTPSRHVLKITSRRINTRVIEQKQWSALHLLWSTMTTPGDYNSKFNVSRIWISCVRKQIEQLWSNTAGRTGSFCISGVGGGWGRLPHPEIGPIIKWQSARNLIAERHSDF